MKRIPDGTVLWRGNKWGIPRKRALFVSDGPVSTTSGSDILEGHYDRPPEEEYSDIPKSGRPHDGYVAEGLCSPIRQLEKAVVRLQQEIADYRAELKLNRTQSPAVSTRHWDSVQTTVESTAPTPEVPAVEKLLQRLVADTQSRPRPDVSPSAPTELEQSMRPFLAEQRRRRRQPCSEQVVTVTRDENTELSPSGCESSRADRFRRVDTLIPRAGDNHAVDKLLQQLGTETQSYPPPVVSPPAQTELGQLMCSFIAGQRRRRRSPRRQQPTGLERRVLFLLCYVSPVGSRVMQQHDART